MTDTATPFGVHSEVGQLRKVMVCAPGRAHQRLTPSNCDELLFDDVLWVENAKRDHFDFITKMRDRGVEVVEMHNLLAETVADPGRQEVDPRQSGRRRTRSGLGLVDEVRSYLEGLAAARTRRDADRRPVDPGVPGAHRRRDAGARARRGRRQRISAAAAAQHALHARHDLLDLWRRDAEPALLAGAPRGDDPHHRRSTSSIPLRRQGQRLVGRSDRGLGPRHARGRRRDADRQGQRADRHERAHLAPGDQPARRGAVREGRAPSASSSPPCRSCARRCISTRSSPSPTATAC